MNDSPRQPNTDCAPELAWPRCEPADAGIDPQAVDDCIDYARAHPTHGLLALRGGRVFAEWYAEGFDASSRFDTYSAAKSVTSAAVGIAVAEGLVQSIDDPVDRYVEAPRPAHEAAAAEPLRLRHLLTMSSGIDWDHHRDYTVMRERDDWLSYIRECTLSHCPGTRWKYTGADVLLLGAALQAAAGRPLDDYAREKVFEPLGMSGVEWLRDATGTTLADGYIHATLRDLARFGWLYARGGVWDGRRIVPREWVDVSTCPNGLVDDYGMLWWTRRLAGAPDDTFYAFGGFGQYLFVVPSLDLVIVRVGHDSASTPKDFPDRLLGGLVGGLAEG